MTKSVLWIESLMRVWQLTKQHAPPVLLQWMVLEEVFQHVDECSLDICP